MSRFTLYLFYFLHHPLRPLGRETTQSISFWVFFPKFPICLRVFCSNWKQYFSSANRGKNITLQRFVMFFLNFPHREGCDQSFEVQVRASSCDAIRASSFRFGPRVATPFSSCGFRPRLAVLIIRASRFRLGPRVAIPVSSCGLQPRLAVLTCGFDLRSRLAASSPPQNF